MDDPGLRELLDALSKAQLPEGWQWKEWQVERVSGGANNQIFHIRGPAGDLAIKFTLRDRRFRAEREYAALQALELAGLEIAPRAVLLEATRYPLPVVVQEWLPGPVSPNPPEDEAAWEALLEHYAAIHSLTPGKISLPLRKAVVNFSSARQGVQVVVRMARALPPEGRPPGLDELVGRLTLTHFPRWQPPTLTLCRTDPAPLNFIRRPGSWASVDWENSGWGDPAFEIADLLAHPAYLDVTVERQEWVTDRYCRQTGDAQAEVRIHTDFQILQAFWVVRMARYRYEVPRGQDDRLVERPDGWEADIWAKYARYQEKAHAALDSTNE